MTTPLKEGTRWETERNLPREEDGMDYHKCGWATVNRRFKHNGVPCVSYSYCDVTTFGYFCGRDQDSEEDFRRMYPHLKSLT